MTKSELSQIEKFRAAVRELDLDDGGVALDGFLKKVAADRDQKIARKQRPSKDEVPA